MQAYVKFYNRHRPHQSMGNQPLMASGDPIPLRATESPPVPEEVGPVRRHATLGGLLNHYEQKAA